MSTQPRLAEVLAEHQPDECGSCAACSWHPGNDGCFDIDFARHQADAWYQACQITTVAQLDALPPGSVVNAGGAESGAPGASWGSGSWHKSRDSDDPWFYWLMDYGEPASEIPLPALLVWSPEWQKP